VTSSPTSRAVLVTGGSRGIGRAIARAFAERGDRVAVHFGTSRDRAEAVLAELPGSGHVLVQADLADAGSVGAMVDAAADALGGLDVLVNNAGVFVASPPADRVVRGVAGGVGADAGGEPGRGGQRDLPRRAAPAGRRGRRRGERVEPRRLPRGAAEPGLRRVQGRG
jgi:hypothetical protein